MKSARKSAIFITFIIMGVFFVSLSNTYLKHEYKKKAGFVTIDLEEMEEVSAPAPPPVKEVKVKESVADATEPVNKPAPKPSPKVKEVTEAKPSPTKGTKSTTNWAKKRAEDISQKSATGLEVFSDYKLPDLSSSSKIQDSPKGEVDVFKGKSSERPSLRRDLENAAKKSEDDFFGDTTASKGEAGDSQLGYYIDGERDVKTQPAPIYTCSKGGYIHIDIVVDEYGIVQKAKYNKRKSTSSDQCLIDAAEAYALRAVAQPSNKKRQKGMLWYEFVGMNE